YWRAVAFTHAKLFDRAADCLEHVLDPTGFPPQDADRQAVLLPAWRLAITGHPELARRVGTPQLTLPGRRMEAIAAVERELAQAPDAGDLWELKRVLYSALTEEEYLTRCLKPGATRQPFFGTLEGFDYGYVQQLGLALINDPARWQRGVEYLRLAVRGLPGPGPVLCRQIAQAYERAGDADKAWQCYELGKQAGLAVGPKNLPAEDRQTYFGIVKQL